MCLDHSFISNISVKMDYKVVIYSNTNIPNELYRAASCILQDAFEERIIQGLDFKCGHFTPDELKADLSGESYLFIAYDNNENPVGTVSLKIRRKKRYVYGGYENLAVRNTSKGTGVASVLTDELIRFSTEKNLDFITSTTACKARSSVCFHKKKGFKIYMKSFAKKYDSYNFILPLKKLRFLRIEVFRVIIYLIATTATIIRKTK